MAKRKTFEAVDEEAFNQFLESIGLVEKDSISGETYPLAEIRGQIGNDHLDAQLHIDPEDAATLVRKKTGLSFKYSRDGSSRYWTFTVPRRGIFTFELYKGRSTYMTVEHDTKVR